MNTERNHIILQLSSYLNFFSSVATVSPPNVPECKQIGNKHAGVKCFALHSQTFYMVHQVCCAVPGEA